LQTTAENTPNDAKQSRRFENHPTEECQFQIAGRSNLLKWMMHVILAKYIITWIHTQCNVMLLICQNNIWQKTKWQRKWAHRYKF